MHIPRGQGTGGPTGRPTPNQPVGAASPMPLHPLHRESAALLLPSGFSGQNCRRLPLLISRLLSGYLYCDGLHIVQALLLLLGRGHL